MQAIVSLQVDSATGVVTALGARGLPPESNPRDTDFSPDAGTEVVSMVLSLTLATGEG